MALNEAYQEIIGRIGENFRHVCRQATMYELVKPERSVHHRLEQGERELPLPEDDRLLDVVLHGVDIVRRELATQTQALMNSQAAARLREAVATPETPPAEEEFTINILDGPPADSDVEINFGEDALRAASGDLETSYADKLDNVAVKTNKIFATLSTTCSATMNCCPGCVVSSGWKRPAPSGISTTTWSSRCCASMTATCTTRNCGQAMEIDLESVSDLEELMRVWDGLHKLETTIPA
jgi:hypothetical protein